MAISVITRPEKTLPDTFVSRWNSTATPVNYELNSDKFPVNSADTIYTITNVVYVASKALTEITYSPSVDAYLYLQVIKVEGTGIQGLDGQTFRIKEVATGKVYIDFFTTLNGFSGTVQRYYNNYKAIVKVYAGAPLGHPYNTNNTKPFVEIGQQEVFFRSSTSAAFQLLSTGTNQGTVNIRDFVKFAMTSYFNESLTNNPSTWNAFRIDYAESFEDSDGSEIFTYTSDFIQDSYEGCTPFMGFKNEEFNEGLTDWVQTCDAAVCLPWVAGSGSVQSISTTGGTSNILNQNLNIVMGTSYKYIVTGTLVSASANVIITIKAKAILGGTWSVLQSSNIGDTPQSFTFEFDQSAPLNFSGIGLDVVAIGANQAFNIVIDSFRIQTTTPDQCLAVNWAIYGAKQFRDPLGGNFGDYVLHSNTSKLLTVFNEYEYFYGSPFYVSAIIPDAVFQASDLNDNVFYRLIIYNSGGVQLGLEDFKIDNNGEGVYTGDPDIKGFIDGLPLEPCGWSYGTIQIVWKDNVGAATAVSEEKRINNNCSCYPSHTPVKLRFMNQLGGWESWTFGQLKVLKNVRTKNVEIRRDVTANFDEYFINGETEYQSVSMEAREELLIRSMALTQDQQINVSQLLMSPLIQILDAGKWLTVNLVDSSFVMYDENQKTKTLTFSLRFPTNINQLS